ncbi:BFAR [Symbiodinium necroappetens]|uniref:BFAR protein n=1 Tax=Symbiodinium necroappetens TaxID=1628268 RepID=A0A812P2H6_9DINO|nr:BFAR [Symbiodinium necroappetens]
MQAMPSDDDEEEAAELFSCGICEDLMIVPTTLVCCGRSFCKECVRLWIKTNAQSGGIPRCPGGCMQKVPYRLPKHSIALRVAMETLLPKRLAARLKEAAEDEQEPEQLGGFQAWSEIAASRDILYGNNVIVRQGSPGIVVGICEDAVHLTVKFDEREDGSDLCVNVVPEALMLPLPGGFRLRQHVVALYELLLNSDMKVPLGSVGHVIGSLGEDRITVLFESLSRPAATPGEVHQSVPEYPVSVNIREVAAKRPLVGGFSIAQKVQASMSLVVGSRVVVHAGCRGTVLAEFSDTRLTVVFETSETGAPNCCNVLPLEIMPWCQTLPGLPAGTTVRALHHLMSPHAIIVPAGARGTILGGVDASLVFVSFDNGPAMAAAISSLERVPDPELGSPGQEDAAIPQGSPVSVLDEDEMEEPECPDGPSDKGIACMSTPLDSSSVRVGNVDASG